MCENAEKKMIWTESKDKKKIVAMRPSANNVRASPWLPANNLLSKNKPAKHVNRETCKHTWVKNKKTTKEKFINKTRLYLLW